MTLVMDPSNNHILLLTDIKAIKQKQLQSCKWRCQTKRNSTNNREVKSQKVSKLTFVTKCLLFSKHSISICQQSEKCVSCTFKKWIHWNMLVSKIFRMYFRKYLQMECESKPSHKLISPGKDGTPNHECN